MRNTRSLSAAFAGAVIALSLSACSSNEPVAARDDNAFLGSIYQSAIDWGIATSDAGISDEDYIAFAVDVCARGEGGENWKSISESAPAQELLEHPDSPDAVSAKALLGFAVTSAAEFICPDQYETAVEQITGIRPVEQN